jgi:integrase/recombinase XerC
MKKIIAAYLTSLSFRPSPATRKTYTQGIKIYVKAVGVNAPVNLETYIKFLKFLNPYPSSTQRIYRAAVMGFYKFFSDEYNESVDLLAMDRADDRYLKKPGQRKLHFDRDSVGILVEYATKLRGDLADLRDRAFILFLVDSGARISEACALKRGQVPWKDKELFIIGKGDKEGKIYFSDRSLEAIKQYLDKRAKLDGQSGSPLEGLPLFARHDRGAGRKVKPVQAGGMWCSFIQHMKKAGIPKGSISPHKLRHEAITHYYETTQDIKKTMDFSRHARMDTVNRYTHLIEQGVRDSYDKAFNKKDPQK